MPRQLTKSLLVAGFVGCAALSAAAGPLAGCAGAGPRVESSAEERPYDPRWMERPEPEKKGVPIAPEVVSGLVGATFAAGYDGVAAACGESRDERAERKRREREREAEEERRRPWGEMEERTARRRSAAPETPILFIRPADAP